MEYGFNRTPNVVDTIWSSFFAKFVGCAVSPQGDNLGPSRGKFPPITVGGL